MKWAVTIYVALAVGAVCASVLAELGRKGGTPVVCIGSTSVQPFAEMLAEEYCGKASAPSCGVDVQGGGSTAGVQAVLEGIAEIGMCSRSLKAEEATELTGIPIALDGLAVVVHKSNPVNALTRGQIRDIFSGRVTRWNEVGGADEPIHLITREEGSGTREAFVTLVMQTKDAGGKHGARISRKAMTQESNGAVKELVKHNRRATGYMSLGLVHDELKILTVDGVYPTTEEVTSKRYPLMRPFLFVIRGQVGSAAQGFMNYVLSEEGQGLLVKEGLVSVR